VDAKDIEQLLTLSNTNFRRLIHAAAVSIPRTGYGSPSMASGKIECSIRKTERFQEWEIPTPSTILRTWCWIKTKSTAGVMTTDRIARLNTKSGEIRSICCRNLLNVRRVDVDNSTNPVTFWWATTTRRHIKVERWIRLLRMIEGFAVGCFSSSNIWSRKWPLNPTCLYR